MLTKKFFVFFLKNMSDPSIEKLTGFVIHQKKEEDEPKLIRVYEREKPWVCQFHHDAGSTYLPEGVVVTEHVLKDFVKTYVDNEFKRWFPDLTQKEGVNMKSCDSS